MVRGLGSAALRAGVDSIEHGDGLTAAQMEEMARRRVPHVSILRPGKPQKPTGSAGSTTNDGCPIDKEEGFVKHEIRQTHPMRCISTARQGESR